MRILLIARNFPPKEGGACTLYYEICKRLNPKEIIVLAEKQQGWKEFDKRQKFKIYRINKFSNLDYRVFMELLTVLWIIKKEKIDRICDGHVSQSVVPLLLKKIFKKSYILYAHGEEISADFGGKCYTYFKRKCIKNADKIIAVSNFTKKELLKLGAKNNKIIVINNAVDTKTFRPSKKDKSLIQSLNLKNKRILLTIARLEDRKGIDRTIHALTKIKKEIPNILYLIVGRGEEETKLKTLTNKLNLNKYVKFLGFVPNQDLVKYYNLADLFIMSNITLKDTNTEGFGIVFLEANACGKPVIGGNAGGVPDAIKNRYNGFLVDSNNIDQISEKVITLLKDKNLNKRMGKDAIQWAKKFSYSKLMNQFLETIK